jgi:phenylacetate-CoA ligase
MTASAVPARHACLPARMSAELTGRLTRYTPRLSWDANELAAWQRERLRVLLAHAAGHSPFHARRLRGLEVSRFEVGDLARLPVMTKAQMMAGFDDIVTDRQLSRRLAEQYLAGSAYRAGLLLDEYVCLVSGGSSGLRGVFVQTLGEYADFVASLIRPAYARALAAGGPPPGGLAIGIVAAASPVHSSGFGAAVATGPPVRLAPAPATLPLAEMVARLNAAAPPALLGYPSKLAELAHEKRAGRLTVAPRSVTSISELLTPADRAVIEQGFGVPVINSFVSTEGLAGHSDPGGSVLSFASDLCLAELVDEDNNPVPAGVTSAKVLVTNLHNLTQPLIRYELTDRFTRAAGTPSAGWLRATVEGRADEIFHYASRSIHPHIIRSTLSCEGAVREYQVRQTRAGIDVTCVTGSQLDGQALAARLRDALCQAGLAGPQVTLTLADGIPRDSRTGKVTRFIPLPPGAAAR